MRALALVGIAFALLASGAMVWRLQRRPARRLRATVPPLPLSIESYAWPNPDARLKPVTLAPPLEFTPKRVYLDAGHGAKGNSGNRSALCVDEQDFTLELARDLQGRLQETKLFDVKLSRQAGELVGYTARVAEARRWRADVFVSLHSDVRGDNEHAGEADSCPLNRTAPGFVVLWSDERLDGATATLIAQRQRLAHALAGRLAALGLPAYPEDYRGMYAKDEVPGSLVDRHAKGKRILVLRRPSMPSVIIETHNAWDDREARRWQQANTRAAFATAVAAGLVDALSETSQPMPPTTLAP